MQVRYQTWRLYRETGWQPTIVKVRILTPDELKFLQQFTQKLQQSECQEHLG
jgi:hypothetical protein